MRAALFALAALAANVSPVQAQFVPIGPGVADVMMPVIMNPCPDNRCPGAASSGDDDETPAASFGSSVRRALTSNAGRGQRPATSAQRFTYSRSPAVATEVRQGLVQRITRYNASYGRQVGAQLARHDALQVYSGIVAPFGLKRGDLADSMTAYTLLAWIIANGGADPARGEVAAVRARVAGELASNPQLSSPANRQRMDEELMYLFVILHAGWQSAQKEGKLDQYSDGVAATFRKQFGRDLRRLELTTTGFVERG